MKKILAMGGSTSRNSINRTLAGFAASTIKGAEVNLLNFSSFNVPLFSVDAEQATGIPDRIKAFVDEIEECDGIVLSLAEHNGSYAAAFKSIFDWATRHKQKVWSGKPMLLLSTSPGGRGGANVMEAALKSFPHLGGNIVAHFSLPKFDDNFAEQSGITDSALRAEFEKARDAFMAVL